MAIGDTVQAGLMRVDFSPIARAGEAQARANQAFGDAIGGVIDKFYQKKKDKQEREEREQAYLKMGLSDEEAKAASRDKDLANQFINKMNADRNYSLEMDKFNQAVELRDLQMAQIRQNMARQKSADQLAGEKRMADNQFMQSLMSQTTSPQAQRQADIARPGLPALGNADARNRFMQAQLQQPQNQVPVSNLGSQDFGRFAREQGLDPTRSVQRMEALRQAELANQPKAITPEELLSLKGKILDFELKQNEENRKSTEFSDSESIKTFTPESNYLQLGTTKIPITGRLGSQTEAIKYKDEYIPNFNTTNETFEGLLALGQKRADGWYMESQEKDQAMSYVRQLQGLIREDILGPGTVQESERNILDNIVKNPTSWSINGAEENMKILRNLRQKIFNRLENRMKNFNLKLGDSNLTNTPKDQPDYTDETSSGNRIRIFDFDNLNQ